MNSWKQQADNGSQIIQDSDRFWTSSLQLLILGAGMMGTTGFAAFVVGWVLSGEHVEARGTISKEPPVSREGFIDQLKKKGTGVRKMEMTQRN